jgi:thiol-disulfide isomerase/thioredoxin
VTVPPPGPGPAQPVSGIGVLLGIAVVIASALGGYAYYRLSKPSHPTIYAVTPTPPPATQGPAVVDAPAAQPGAPATGRRVPEKVPDLALPGLDGSLHKLSGWTGRPLLINFWATWCEPCRREIPLLKSLRKEHEAKRLEIVGIAIDFRDTVRKYVAEHGMNYPILLGERGGFEAAAAFGMDTVLPFSVFADAQGRIVALKVGELHRDEAELILDRIGTLDSGHLSLKTARDESNAGIARLAASRVRAGARAAQ